MPTPTYSTQFNQALDLYFAKKYPEALAIFTELLESTELENNQKADLLRRIADCRSYIDPQPELIELYDQALSLTGSNKTQRCWILASKASALAIQHDYVESLRCYAAAIELAEDLDDLEHLQQRVEEILDEQEKYVQYGDPKTWKKDLINSVTDKQKKIEAEEFWRLAQGKEIIKD
jgi:tetratricopeptide (TPR) repeat protein